MTTQRTRQCALQLEALPHRIGQVRRIVSAQLRYWQLDPIIDTALLGITELLANVHRHAQPDKHCTVELSYGEGRLTVSVFDHDPRPPRIGLRTDAMDTCGRGLAMLAALSDGWGTRPGENGDGKVVWFTLRDPITAPTPVAVPARAPVAAVPPGLQRDRAGHHAGRGDARQEAEGDHPVRRPLV
ncbi:ATP-binding protein, partial [Streptantibioticus parmotrematis]|uniref:ATP-binding protein n=1 Tax=Streptantibioticus parmotrematis TaxID=2873249 RepID=UPI0033D5AF09